MTADDVAGHLHSRADFASLGDRVAHFDELRELAVAVAQVRHAVLEVHLRGFEGDLRPALPVEDGILLPVLPEAGAVEARVDVRIHKAGGEELPRPVDDPRAVGHRGGGARPHGGEAGAFNDDGGVGERCTPVTINDGGPDDGDHLLGNAGGRRRPNGERHGE